MQGQRLCRTSRAPAAAGSTSPAASKRACTCRGAPASRRLRRSAAVNVVDSSAVDQLASLEQLQRWLSSGAAGASAAAFSAALEPKRFKADGGGDRVGFIAATDVDAGQPLLTLPELVAITAVDAEAHPLVGAVASTCSELVALALWLMAERAAGSDSRWAPLLQAVPATSHSPLLWDEAERTELLTGSPTLAEARARVEALRQQWTQLQADHLSKDPERFPPTVFNEPAFLRAFCVVLRAAAFLPAAQCFALLPLVGLLGRTGNDNGADLDYDPQTGSVVLLAGRPYREGQEVLINDGRANGELLLATGSIQDNNLSDCLTMSASLLQTDKYYRQKMEVLQSLGLSALEQFPVYRDRFPLQLLSYLRLARIQDPALFAKVSFEADVVITQMNEYEVLQLLMGDCRERLSAYPYTLEEVTKQLQNPELTGRARLATKLVACEMGVLSSTMDAVRRKLAPIRGIPTKSGGMQDPNQDIKEVFDFIDDLPKKPAKLFDSLRRWAQGEFDPEWGQKPPPR